MTPATLRAWIKSRRLSHQEAAALLALSIPGLRKNLYGVNPINPQTERIIKLLDRSHRYEELLQAVEQVGVPEAVRRIKSIAQEMLE